MKKRLTAAFLGTAMAVSALVSFSVPAEEDPAQLRLIFYGDSSTRRDDFFKNEFHDAVLEDLNIDLTVEFLPWGSDTNISTMLASGEKFAMEYIVGAFDWHTKGYLAPIDEALIDEYMPEYKEARGINGLDCVRYEGDVYAIPFGNKPYSGAMQYFDLRGDILDELGYKPEEITTLEKLEEVFDKVQETHPEMRIITNPDFLPFALWDVCTDGKETRSTNENLMYTYVNEEEEGNAVYSYFESEGFKNLCAITSRWVEKGYLDKDLITNPSQGEADWFSANCFARNGMPGCLISSTLKTANPDAYETMVKIGDQLDVKTKDYDWALAVSAADSDNVENWLKLFNWMYLDQDHYRFCIYGVEGKDYKVNEDGSITKLVNDSFIDGWFMEDVLFDVYDPSLPEEAVEGYRHFDDDAHYSKLTGFSFDSTPVQTELAMLTSIYDEKLKPMTLGFIDYESNIDSVIEEMKKAGLETYIAEYEKQYKAFCGEE